jgi:hypothetical protein
MTDEEYNKIAAAVLGRLAASIAEALGLTLVPKPRPASDASGTSSSASGDAAP